MIFADKLIALRKKSGWSQEELAEQMDVTRQSVSKWESAQSVPDLEKMVRLSKLFSVSTDYLLKDEVEEFENTIPVDESSKIRRVSMQEASDFLSVKRSTAKSIANATFLCILSPICLIMLLTMSEHPIYLLSENIAIGIGMIILLTMVSIAVAIYIISGSKTSQYSYLETEPFETEYGVTEMVKKQKNEYKITYTKYNVFGTYMCIFSVIPLFGGLIIDGENALIMTLMASLLLLFVGIGVIFFITGGIVWASFEKLLQEGDYTKQKKDKSSVSSVISSVYWSIVTVIFLSYGFTTNNWGASWIIWVIAGILFPAITAIFSFIDKDNNK